MYGVRDGWIGRGIEIWVLGVGGDGVNIRFCGCFIKWKVFKWFNFDFGCWGKGWMNN